MSLLKNPFSEKKAEPEELTAEEILNSSSSPDAQWELISRTFIDPKPITVSGDDRLNKIALCGMTTYLFHDKTHNIFKTVETFGLEQTSLDRLLDKVDVGGPEYILRDGKTYILLKQEKQELPVR